MITIYKQEVANWLLMDCLATLHTLQEKLRFFEKKYQQSWENFSQQISTSSEEDFSKWDDYIEWKSYIKMTKETETKIQEVKHGNFNVA